jgi:hypothetical protein
MINDFNGRQKLSNIYDVVKQIDFNLLDTLELYDIVSSKEAIKLTEKFSDLEDRIFKQLKEFDKQNNLTNH